MQDGVVLAFAAIGTQWHIAIAEPLSVERSKQLETAIRQRLAVFDRYYSRFRNDSVVARMAHTAGTYVLPNDARPMLDWYAQLYHVTGGAFTPLIGGALSDAGYDAVYSFQSKPLRKPAVWDRVMTYRFPQLITNEPVQLDFGGLGKGYAIDLIGELLESHGVQTYTIDAGGDIRHRSRVQEQIRIGLEDPEDASRVIGVASIGQQSICGSAGSRRAWKEFHHILDPRTLTSPRHIAASWVIANTTLIADGLATCLFLTEPTKLQKVAPFEYLVLFADRTIERSPGFSAELFTAETD